MKKNFANSILKKIVLIVLLSILSFISFVYVEHFIIKKNVKSLDKKIQNQEAKLEIGRFISNNINKSHLEISHLLNLSNAKNYKIFKVENDLLIKRIFEMLEIIQNGGTYNYKVEYNFNEIDFLNKSLTYKKPDNAGIVIEVINLTPMIIDIQHYFNSIIELNKKSITLTQSDEIQKCFNEINLEEKKLHSLYIRAIEDVNQIFFEVELNIEKLKMQKTISNHRNFTFLIFLGFFLIFITIMVSIILTKQINRLIKEKVESEEKLIMIEDSSDAIVIIQNQKFVYVNKAISQLLNYSKQELLMMDIKAIFTKETMKIIGKNCNEESAIIVFESSLQKKNGQKIFVEMKSHSNYYRGEKSQFVVIRDVTKQKEIMEELQKGAEQTKGLNEFIPICAGCSLIRDDEKEGSPWVKPAEYISERLPEIKFSHTMCPDCVKKWYPDLKSIND